jgi:crotonobetainyl-CoA:carnitine CoA-transferase CaiB-like acyl-CoA transferase
MRFLVGGSEIEFTSDAVIEAMVDKEPDVVREYFVEHPSGWFPPKQILECVTKWSRSTFTSHEAVRVLNRLGFPCRRADELGSASLMKEISRKGDFVESSRGREVGDLQDEMKVLEVAVAGLARRVELIESTSR